MYIYLVQLYSDITKCFENLDYFSTLYSAQAYCIELSKNNKDFLLRILKVVDTYNF